MNDGNLNVGARNGMSEEEGARDAALNKLNIIYLNRGYDPEQQIEVELKMLIDAELEGFTADIVPHSRRFMELFKEMEKKVFTWLNEHDIFPTKCKCLYEIIEIFNELDLEQQSMLIPIFEKIHSRIRNNSASMQ